MKHFLIIFFTGMIILCLLVFLCAGLLLSARTSQAAQLEYILKVPSGATVRQIASELQHAEIIRSKTAFYYAARFSHFMLKAGQFTVSSTMSVLELLEELSSSKPIPVKLSIPEGYTITQIARLLEKAEVTDAADFIAACSDAVLLASYDIPARNAEGYLFPDTYYFDTGMHAETVARIMIDTFYMKIADIPAITVSDAQKLFKTVTLASIVEREYRVAEEAPLMASVFTNRLKYNIGLESCATIVYILTEIEGKPHPDAVTYDDLKINNAYNTYKWAGLPPGPISNPGITALKAAANPPKTEYYYFRLTNPEKGTHNFTTTLSEHVQAGLSIKK